MLHTRLRLGWSTLIRDWKNNPANKNETENGRTKGNFAYASNLVLDQEETEEDIARESSISVVSQQDENAHVMHRLSIAPGPRQSRLTIKEDLNRLELHAV